jgi:predicted TPR repeat methyltransferase
VAVNVSAVQILGEIEVVMPTLKFGWIFIVIIANSSMLHSPTGFFLFSIEMLSEQKSSFDLPDLQSVARSREFYHSTLTVSSCMK